MLNHSRYYYVISLLVGLWITTVAIAGYAYLNPDKANNPSTFLFVAVVGFLLMACRFFPSFTSMVAQASFPLVIAREPSEPLLSCLL